MKKLTIKEAVKLLIDGEAVGIPTETVYGLAADARSDVATRKIFEAKGRPSDNPLIVHIGERTQLEDLVTDVSEDASLLMDAFWPGPLTLILKSKGVVSTLVSAGLDTIGIRMPGHKVALAILRQSGVPLAAPSANVSGKPSPTCAEHVVHDMQGRIVGVVDGGTCEVGLESTVIDMTRSTPIILRPGGISRAEIETLIGSVALTDEENPEVPRAPGMKYRHYAPEARVYLVKGSPAYFKKKVLDFKEKGLKVGELCCGMNEQMVDLGVVAYEMGERGQQLYAALRDFDAAGVDVVLCEYVEDEAVSNRLIKASEGCVLDEMED